MPFAFYCPFNEKRAPIRMMMLNVLMRVATWDQLERIWEFIVGFFRFLWALLKFLGGGG